MPKVNIREIDTTGSDTINYLDYTVLVPGVFLEYEDENGKTVPFKGLFTRTSQFSVNFIEESGASEFYKDMGFLTAYQLVAKGLSVYYIGAYSYDENGDKSYINYFDPISGESVALNAQKLFSEFADKGKYDLRFITIGGLDFDLINASEAAVRCAGDRGDAIALLDVPTDATFEVESGEVTANLDNAPLIDLWVNDVFKGVATEKISRNGVSWTGTENTTETYGRYAAIFAPHFTTTLSVVDPRPDGQTKAQSMLMPASFDYLSCFAKQLQTYQPWFATAGSVRGVSPLATLTPTALFGDADVDILQLRTTENEKELNHLATNVITNIRPYGNIIWGNRTMHPLNRPDNGESDAAVQLTASSFLNIRQLCCTLKKVIYRACKRYTFDPNSDALWFNLSAAITPTLETMKSNQGIRDYSLTRINTSKKALLVARITITPIEAVEDFDIDVVLSDTVEVTE